MDDFETEVAAALSRIGVGVVVQLHFDGTNHIGTYLGMQSGNAILSVTTATQPFVAMLPLSKITAVKLF